MTERFFTMDHFWEFPYPSQRMPVLARNVVATSQPLATQAGLRMLLKGGNAVDAALAAAITLTVVEPTGNGIGGDAFAIVWDGKTLHGLNGSGRAPRALSRQRYAGLAEMPRTGWETVTVPGAVDAWVRLSSRLGKLPFAELFAPAIDYAEHGFPVSPITAGRWQDAWPIYAQFPEIARTFFPQRRAPRAGEFFRCPEQAETLAAIAASRGEAFYRGRLAERIAACAAAEGGALTRADLDAHRSDWVEPLCRDYRGARLHEIPPNGQGIAALIALGILSRFELSRHAPESAASLHLQIEAMKAAFAEVFRHVADSDHMRVAPEELLAERRLAALAAGIDLDRAAPPTADAPAGGGTVYLAAADAGGAMVSLIQSNYLGFGSGVVVPGTGIALHNRGCGFVLEAGHPNEVGGGKRPFHTIIPGFVTRGGRPLISFGVMGAHMQPQGHLQMMVRICDYGQNPQAALDAPRWHVAPDASVALEAGFPAAVVADLRKRGHRVVLGEAAALFGGGQTILRLPEGYLAASDPRKDGQAAGF
ncbi:MAG: gamma-glutamyltransferase family protein [Desulfobacterales bacterium]|jgi:gamma-glutamyltranspeptidase/glutathione hydrolase|nr:gamma-glutamyltransferase family protein [Desulfobacterales bacterium]